jgi:hypothetical protein
MVIKKPDLSGFKEFKANVSAMIIAYGSKRTKAISY